MTGGQEQTKGDSLTIPSQAETRRASSTPGSLSGSTAGKHTSQGRRERWCQPAIGMKIKSRNRPTQACHSVAVTKLQERRGCQPASDWRVEGERIAEEASLSLLGN